MSRARVYADVNVHKPREYWDYENLTVHWGCALLPPSPRLPWPAAPRPALPWPRPASLIAELLLPLRAYRVASSPSAWPPCRGRGPSVIAELLLRTAGTRRTTS